MRAFILVSCYYCVYDILLSYRCAIFLKLTYSCWLTMCPGTMQIAPAGRHMCSQGCNPWCETDAKPLPLSCMGGSAAHAGQREGGAPSIPTGLTPCATHMPPLRGWSVFAWFTVSISADYIIFLFWQLFAWIDNSNPRNRLNHFKTVSVWWFLSISALR